MSRTPTTESGFKFAARIDLPADKGFLFADRFLVILVLHSATDRLWEGCSHCWRWGALLLLLLLMLVPRQTGRFEEKSAWCCGGCNLDVVW